MMKYLIPKRIMIFLVMVGVLMAAGASFGKGPAYTLKVKEKVAKDQSDDDNEKEDKNGYISTSIDDYQVCTLDG